MKEEEIGKIYPTKNYGPIKIVKYVSSKEVYVLFSDGTIKRTWWSQVKSGLVRNPTMPAIHGKKRTAQELAIKALVDKHGDTYDYSSTVYVSATDPISIRCKIHGEFEQIYSYHKSGRGCSKCAIEKNKEHTRKRAGHTTESVIKDFLASRGDLYDYSEVEYIDSRTKLKIICKKHGPFYQTRKVHLKGHGCSKCNAETVSINQTYDQEKFLCLCRGKDKENNFDYSETTYNSMKERIQVRCIHHGYFTVLACSHLNNNAGCPECNGIGFNYEKPGRLYVIGFDDILKVGITNRDVKSRLKEIVKESGLGFKVLFVNYFEVGKSCYDVERRCLKFLRSNYKNIDKSFTGHSECFVGVDQQEFLKFLQDYLDEEKIPQICE